MHNKEIVQVKAISSFFFGKNIINIGDVIDVSVIQASELVSYSQAIYYSNEFPVNNRYMTSDKAEIIKRIRAQGFSVDDNIEIIKAVEILTLLDYFMEKSEKELNELCNDKRLIVSKWSKEKLVNTLVVYENIYKKLESLEIEELINQFKLFYGKKTTKVKKEDLIIEISRAFVLQSYKIDDLKVLAKERKIAISEDKDDLVLRLVKSE